MVRVQVLLFIILAVSALPVMAQDGNPCQESILEYSTENYEAALGLFNDCIENNSPPEGVYLLRGITHLELKNIDEALADFEAYVDANPEDYTAYYSVADKLEEANLFRYAIDYIETALELNAECAECYYVRAQANFEADKFEDAIDDYTRTIELEPDFPDFAYYNRGSAKYNLQRFEDAVEDYTLHIERFPEDARGYQQRGDTYWQMKEYDKAIDDYYEFQERNSGELTQRMQDRIDERNDPLNGIPPLAFLGAFVIIGAYIMWRARREDRKP